MMLEKYLLALTITFGLLALVGWLAQRYGTRGFTFRHLSQKPADLQLLHTLILTPQHRLHHVQYHGRSHLIITHPQGASWLPPETTPKQK